MRLEVGVTHGKRGIYRRLCFAWAPRWFTATPLLRIRALPKSGAFRAPLRCI